MSAKKGGQLGPGREQRTSRNFGLHSTTSPLQIPVCTSISTLASLVSHCESLASVASNSAAALSLSVSEKIPMTEVPPVAANMLAADHARSE